MRRRDFLKRSAVAGAAAIFAKGFLNPGILLSSNDDYEIKLIKKKLSGFSRDLAGIDISEAIRIAGESLLGTSYEAGTLDVDANEEKLVLKLSGLDCVTFVENTLTFARQIRLGDFDFETYKKQLTNIRYRNGEILDYTSRLHYFCDWIFENEKKGLVTNITKDIGGSEYSKDINFMTTHTDSYKQLKKHPELVNKMQEIESDINTRQYYYIPKVNIQKFYDSMQTGDIIATTTEISGLDVTHTGYIYKAEGMTLFMNASSIAKEVIITAGELKDYLMSIKKCTGIMIERPQ